MALGARDGEADATEDDSTATEEEAGAMELDSAAMEGTAGTNEDTASGAAEKVLLAPTVTVCTRVVVCNRMLVSTAVTVIRSGAVGQMLRGVELLKEIVGVADGMEELPVRRNEEAVTLSEVLGVIDGMEELPVIRNEEVVRLNDGLGATDGMLVVSIELLARVILRIVLELLKGGTKEDAPPVGALVVFEGIVGTPELRLGIAEDVELIDAGGRVDDAAVGNLVVELLDGVGIPEDEPTGNIKVLGRVAEVLTLAKTGGVTKVVVGVTRVVLGSEEVGLALIPVPGCVKFERVEEGRLKDPDRRLSVLLKGVPVEVAF